ncbi:F-box protein At1g80960-like [Abrus precatorius]|uniref:F-box protein At1g80960-like n=1 Tax=Abrus precatorius TaxID=3816 RepID=A0A8B8KGM8_ABRPR|nr:F-box protein At1g80960-like [Abrus precatorius]
MEQARMRKKVRKKEEELPDFINNLPDEILCMILSLLPVDEAVRTGILSKRWRSLWKHTSRLDFDVKHMIHPFSGLNKSPYDHLLHILDMGKVEGTQRYGILFFLILRQHLSDLTSCRFLHLPDTEVCDWVQYLFERKKGLKDLSLECEEYGGISKRRFPSTKCFRDILSSLRSLELTSYFIRSTYAFSSCNNLRTLKLKRVIMPDEIINGILRSCVSLENFSLIRSYGFKEIKINNSCLKFLELNYLRVDNMELYAENLEVLVLDSFGCYASNLVLVAPNLRVLNCCRRQCVPESYDVLKYHILLEYCSDFWESKRSIICGKLSSLSIDLDLNNVREALSISNILRSSIELRSLRVFIPPVNGNANLETSSIAVRDLLDLHNFLGGKEISNCTRHKLKFLCIEGFTGTELEVQVIRYLMLSSSKLETINIFCGSSMEDTHELLSLQGASMNFTIKLMVAKRFL